MWTETTLGKKKPFSILAVVFTTSLTVDPPAVS